MDLEKVMEVMTIKQEVKEGFANAPIVRSPDDAYEVAKEYIGDKDREHFLVMMLNTKNKITSVHIAHIGTIDCSIVNPADVFKVALLNNAKNVIICHNHPSYDLNPSNEDLKVTKRIWEAGKLLNVQLLDSLIIGNGYISLKEKGYLD